MCLKIYQLDPTKFLPALGSTSQFLNCFIILMRLIFSFFYIRSLLIPCEYVSIESIDCFFLSSFELKAIFLISSVKTLWFCLKIFACVFNIIFSYFLISSRLSASVSLFFKFYYIFNLRCFYTFL